MSKRLPQPPDPKHVRLLVSDAELEQMERMAVDCRLSVASFVRAAMVAMIADWPANQQAVKEAAGRIMADAPADRPRPGRPAKKTPPGRPRKS